LALYAPLGVFKAATVPHMTAFVEPAATVMGALRLQVPLVYVETVDFLEKNWHPVKVMDLAPVLCIESLFIAQKVFAGHGEPVWRVTVIGLNESVTGTSTSASGLEELDGVTKAVPFDVSLAANTRGELPIANKAATATIKADVTKRDFMVTQNCLGEY
jgi:hypothetical protein